MLEFRFYCKSLKFVHGWMSNNPSDVLEYAWSIQTSLDLLVFDRTKLHKKHPRDRNEPPRAWHWSSLPTSSSGVSTSPSPSGSSSGTLASSSWSPTLSCAILEESSTRLLTHWWRSSTREATIQSRRRRSSLLCQPCPVRSIDPVLDLSSGGGLTSPSGWWLSTPKLTPTHHCFSLKSQKYVVDPPHLVLPQIDYWIDPIPTLYQ